MNRENLLKSIVKALTEYVESNSSFKVFTYSQVAMASKLLEDSVLCMFVRLGPDYSVNRLQHAEDRFDILIVHKRGETTDFEIAKAIDLVSDVFVEMGSVSVYDFDNALNYLQEVVVLGCKTSVSYVDKDGFVIQPVILHIGYGK